MICTTSQPHSKIAITFIGLSPFCVVIVVTVLPHIVGVVILFLLRSDMRCDSIYFSILLLLYNSCHLWFHLDWRNQSVILFLFCTCSDGIIVLFWYPHYHLLILISVSNWDKKKSMQCQIALINMQMAPSKRIIPYASFGTESKTGNISLEENGTINTIYICWMSCYHLWYRIIIVAIIPFRFFLS